MTLDLPAFSERQRGRSLQFTSYDNKRSERPQYSFAMLGNYCHDN